MYKSQAIEKLNKEEQAFQGDRKAQVIYRPVASALRDFCAQDDEFAQAVVQTDKTLSDCCKEILKDVKDSISDLEAYRSARKVLLFHGRRPLPHGDRPFAGTWTPAKRKNAGRSST